MHGSPLRRTDEAREGSTVLVVLPHLEISKAPVR